MAHRAVALVFLLALLPGLCATSYLHTTARQQAAAEIDRIAALAVDRVLSRVGQHVLVLRASRGMWDALGGQVSREAFTRFLASVDLDHDMSGARGIGFAPMIAPNTMANISDRITASYGVMPAPPAPTDQDWRTPVLLLEPANATTLQALGYDMYTEPTRRSAMLAALQADTAQMSGPVDLVGSSAPQADTGFLIYLPLSTPPASPQDAPPATGFVFAAFRGQDLIEAALTSGPHLSVRLDVIDVSAPDNLLYAGTGTATGDRRVITARILGREWQFSVQGIGNPGRAEILGRTAFLALLSVLFASAMGYAVAVRQAEVALAQNRADAATRDAEYRNLLVQEMKHRLKNYITRIQSIARQSARGATDVSAFTDAFEARLRAMASVQEILAGTALPQADVRAILHKELQQGLDSQAVEHLIDGPPVCLDDRQAHAFGMVVHELTTNAMKYGGLSEQGRGLKVTWSTEPAQRDRPARLVVNWWEQFERPATAIATRSGFGSRLIEASLKGELAGTLERAFRQDGLTISFAFPLTPPVAS